MTNKEKEILYEILEILIHKQYTFDKTIDILQREIKILNKKLNLLRGGNKCSK